jgi:hypothetical protein
MPRTGLIPVIVTISLVWTAPVRGQAMGDPALEKKLADCLGIDQQTYHDATNPTNGEPRRPTKDEQKRNMAALKLLNKIPKNRVKDCNDKMVYGSLSAMTPQIDQLTKAAKAQMESGKVPGESDVKMSEAPGKEPALADDPAAELAAGKTVVRDIDWIAGKGKISEGATDAVAAAVTQLADAMVKVGGRFRLDFYLDQRYSDDAVEQVVKARFHALREALIAAAGDHPLTLTMGKGKRDDDPRLELVHVK